MTPQDLAAHLTRIVQEQTAANPGIWGRETVSFEVIGEAVGMSKGGGTVAWIGDSEGGGWELLVLVVACVVSRTATEEEIREDAHERLSQEQWPALEAHGYSPNEDEEWHESSHLMTRTGTKTVVGMDRLVEELRWLANANLNDTFGLEVDL